MDRIEWTTDDDDGNEVVHALPAHYEVCWRCEGRGRHTNPNIDGHGITQDEWDRDWSHEDRENYMNGFYDVSCYECGGKRVVLVLDEEAARREDPELLNAYLEHLDDESDYGRLVAFERRFGC